MIQRRRCRGAGPWRPGCEGLEGRVLLSLEFAPAPPGLETFVVGPTTPLSAPPTPTSLVVDPGSSPLVFSAASLLAIPPLEPPTGTPPGEVGEPAAFLNVVGVEPASGAPLRQSPDAFAVRFDRPLNPLSAGVDLLLVRGDGAGGWEPEFDESIAPLSRVDPNDATRLVLDLEPVLGPGRYRLVLSGRSSLTDAAGRVPLPDRGGDAVLAEFTIERPGTSLGDATDLGRVGREVRAVDGKLDFAADPSAVVLYRVTLPPSHRLWRLGLEVEAESLGTPLNATLALFDAEGRVLAVAEDGGFVGAIDPHLFHGLAPGTYYVGVSGAGSPPGRPGGYDPATGDPGAASQDQPGGSFRLHLVADPLGASSSRLGFRLNHADSTVAIPTGFDIQFSGLVRAGEATPDRGGSLSEAVELVDQHGQAWPIAAVAYRGDEARLSYVFLSRLPAGRYSVRLPGSGGLVDLSGCAPKSHGLPDGVLATFTVGASRPASDPSDFGPVFEADRPDGLTATLDLEAGESRELRIVLLRDTDLRLTALHEGGAARVELLNVATGEARPIDLGDAGEVRTAQLLLSAGEYLVRVRAIGAEPVRAKVAMQFSGTWAESLSPSGVGQGPALSLRLVAPTASSLTSAALLDASTPPPSSGGGAPNPTPLLEPVWPTLPGSDSAPEPWSPGSTPAVAFGPGGFEGSGTLLAVATGPVGLPSDEAGFALSGTAGPLAAGVALEASAPSSAFGDPSNPLAAPEVPTVVAASPAVPSTEGAMLPPEGELVPIVAEASPPVAAAGLDVDGVARLFQQLLGRLPAFGGQGPPIVATASPSDGDANPALVAAAGRTTAAAGVPEAEAESPEVVHPAHASLEVSIGLGVMAAATIQLREILTRRLRRGLAIRRRKNLMTHRCTPAGPLGTRRARQRV